jgi:hypothetical protein
MNENLSHANILAQPLLEGQKGTSLNPNHTPTGSGVGVGVSLEG